MTTQELIARYGGWDCKNGRKRYIAVPFEAGKDNALRIGNAFIKVKRDLLKAEFGHIKGDYIYINKRPGFDTRKIWVISKED